MDLDLDTAPVHAPVEQPEDVQHDQEIDNADDTATATTSKKKGPKKPLQSKAEGGGSKVKDAEKALGTTALPVSRVKKVLSADADLQNTSREALFLISVATVSSIRGLN
ncbi:hypothetical protein QFC19_002834 [Naganishia cerealis]|uniref:Uncharacterized protein n=1 Tax=Naganishia cerealis TaxID=610337 RepID=A0ACC2W7I3_9TREE|nr:hypothetical protein QFC19_002834 [Naganishia cerealis]